MMEMVVNMKSSEHWACGGAVVVPVGWCWSARLCADLLGCVVEGTEVELARTIMICLHNSM